MSPATRADVLADYAAGEPLKVISARYDCSRAFISELAHRSGLPRRPRGGLGHGPVEEFTVPKPGHPLRAPLIPWYAAPPLANALEKIVVVQSLTLAVQIWPRGAKEVARGR